MFYENLPEEHKRFVDAYVDCLNRRKAYQSVYKDASVSDARVNGSRLAATPNVKAAIEERLKSYSVPKEELIHRMLSLLDFDLSEYMFTDGSIKAKELLESGYGWMVKGVKPTKFGTEIILMDKDRALENLAKINKLFGDADVVINIAKEITAKDQLEARLKVLNNKLNE